ncbi:TauD/TfdA family dioxygenase [Roseibium sp. SCP14]|uniref:TauD/TfdA family dioxygenase n=1 Tax=Roseibium sp. SCP14 TaxID=3141375 RepID=UPI003339B812
MEFRQEVKFDPFSEKAEKFDAQAMKEDLKANGIYRFEFDSTSEVEDGLSRMGQLVNHPDSDGRLATQLEATGKRDYGRGQRGFSNCSLPPHTDQALRSPPLAYLALLCIQPAQVGGESLFVDSKLVYRRLSIEYPKFLEVLSNPEIIAHRFEDQFSSVPVFTALEDDRIIARVRFDELCYSSIAGIDAIQKLREIVEEYTVRISVKQNQGFVVSNSRWLHGRSDFVGERKYLRYLVAANNQNDPNLGFSISNDSNRDIAVKEQIAEIVR